jgi:hypothetical protein
LIPYAQVLGQVLAAFIQEVAQNESGVSPNYIYILFEASALTLTYVKDNKDAFKSVED